MKFLFILLFTFSIIATLYAQQPGMLDRTYGNSNGAEIVGSTNRYPLSSAMQSDDKLIVGGGSFLENILLLTRYNKDGSPDSSFGTNGSVITVFDSTNSLNYGEGWASIVVQLDGKIVATGSGRGFGGDYFNTNILVARFLPDGTLDETFGMHGEVVSDLAYFDISHAIALQPDGKIVVVSEAYDDLDENNIRSLVIRYNTDGSLDKSFGEGTGFVTYETNGPIAYAVTVQSDNKIIVGGGIDVNELFFVARYLPDGTLDGAFGKGGVVTTSFGDAASGVYVKSLAIDDHQRIVAAGNAPADGMTVARYLPDGTLDNSFDEDGKKFISFPNGYTSTTNIFLPNPDKIVVAGYIIIFNKGADFALAALNSSDGSFDSSFGTNGETTTDFGYNEKTFSAALQSDGKIILTALDEYNSPYPYLNARYYGYPQKVSLLVRIKRYLQNHTITWNGLPADDKIAYYSVEQSSSTIKGFTPIAKLSGRGNQKDYSITNSSLLNGRNYYRVKAVSTDGTIRYSEVVSADNTANTASVYPNPAKSYVTVQGLPTKEISNISIVDFTGNVRFSATTNSSSCSINTSNLKPGNYYVNIIANGKTETLKFVKE